jgi:hypothetical protein
MIPKELEHIELQLEPYLDACRHFHLAENHNGSFKCCYNGSPVCVIRGQVCAMLIPEETP